MRPNQYHKPYGRSLARAAFLATAVASLQVTFAADFALGVAPPRFELEAESGDVIRQIIHLKNTSNSPTKVNVRTADWGQNKQGGVTIHPPELQPGSCRPWSRIERHSANIGGASRYEYRFEVHVPEDAERGECRFAILFQQPPEAAGQAMMGDLNVPVVGQIAVIVYVAVNGAAPELNIVNTGRMERSGASVPALVVENTGDAHGRLEGVLVARAPGNDVEEQELVVSNTPILPGERRTIPLWPAAASGRQAPAGLEFPLEISGAVSVPGQDDRDIETTVE